MTNDDFKMLPNSEIDKTCVKSLEVYGSDLQLDILVEECSELIKSIMKFKRERIKDNINNIVEEIADVKIMIREIEIAFKFENEIKKLISEKILRVNERIEEDEKYIKSTFFDKIKDTIMEVQNVFQDCKLNLITEEEYKQKMKNLRNSIINFARSL